MPNDSWYVLVGGQQHGPYPLAAMQQFMAEGRVTPQTIVRQGETGDGTAAGQVLDFSQVSPSAFPPGGPVGYASPPRSSRGTWVIPVVICGVCLLLLLMCVVLPAAFWLFAGFSRDRDMGKMMREEAVRVEVEESRKDAKAQAEAEAEKALKDLDLPREAKELKALPPMAPAVKPRPAKMSDDAEPEPRPPQ
jgi:hypothetical protein